MTAKTKAVSSSYIMLSHNSDREWPDSFYSFNPFLTDGVRMCAWVCYLTLSYGSIPLKELLHHDFLALTGNLHRRTQTRLKLYSSRKHLIHAFGWCIETQNKKAVCVCVGIASGKDNHRSELADVFLESLQYCHKEERSLLFALLFYTEPNNGSLILLQWHNIGIFDSAHFWYLYLVFQCRCLM